MKGTEAKLEYKYIVVGHGYDYYHYVYRQLAEMPDATFIENWPFSKVTEKLSYSILKYIWVFLYVRFLKKAARQMDCAKTDRICFLLLAGGANRALLKYGLCERLKRHFVNSKVVYFINNPVAKANLPVGLMKKHADLVFSYSPTDCEKYGLTYHVIPYSEFDFPENINPKYDVVFVGAAKDRIKELLATYRYLHDNGLKCLFRIIDAPEKEKVAAEGISYSGIISYEENLGLLQQGNCILDIIQGESSGNTIRVGEAVIMGKKLLTNNPYTRQNLIFDEKYMRVFSKPEDIDVHFLLDRSPVYYTLKEKMYPMDLLLQIEKMLPN